MSITANANERPSVVRRFVYWWQDWRARSRTMRELGCHPREDIERMARDVGVDSSDLCVLAGKWPNSADLLVRRMDQLEIDANDPAQIEPAVVRDLQRVCTLCASKRKCGHDLARHPSDPAWREYCPNAETLDARIAERANCAGPRAA
jgi:hypothetical protein